MSDTLTVTTQSVPNVMTETSRRWLALLVAALFVVAVGAVDPRGLVPTGPLRWTLMSVLIGAAGGALFVRPLRIDRLTGWLWFAFVAWLFAASIAGADALQAWIGTPDRRLGWFAWCTFPLMFLCGQALSSERDRRIVLRGAAVAAGLLGVWCAFERAGRSLIDESFAGHRVGGPFGQPAYVGAAAVLLVPMAAGVALDRHGSRLWRGVGAFGAVAATGALLMSQTRGAWLGAAVGLGLLGARHTDVVRRRWRELALIAAAAVVLFAVTPFGRRAVESFDLGAGTTRGRFDDWAVGARVVEDHPVLGVGPEGYRVVFPEVVSAAYVRRYGTEVIPDRAHNGEIDVATEGGVAAGLVYVVLLLIVVATAWRAMRGRDPLTIALACAAVGYVVQQQFLFPLSEIDPLFWVVAGMLVATRARAPLVTWHVPRIVPIAIAIATLLGAVSGAREVLADRLLARAADAPGVTDLRDADHATRLRPDSIRGWYAASSIAARGPALTDVDAAIERIERGLRRSPRDPALRERAAALLVERAARSELEDDRDRARSVVAAYLRDAPNDPQLWRDRAEIAQLDGDAAAERDAAAHVARLQSAGAAEPGPGSGSEKS